MSSGKGHFYDEENLSLYWNLAKGTTAKAPGTMAIAVGAVGYFGGLGQCYAQNDRTLI